MTRGPGQRESQDIPKIWLVVQVSRLPASVCVPVHCPLYSPLLNLLEPAHESRSPSRTSSPGNRGRKGNRDPLGLSSLPVSLRRHGWPPPPPPVPCLLTLLPRSEPWREGSLREEGRRLVAALVSGLCRGRQGPCCACPVLKVTPASCQQPQYILLRKDRMWSSRNFPSQSSLSDWSRGVWSLVPSWE